MKKIILAAFVVGGILTVSAQTTPQKTGTSTSTVSKATATDRGKIIPRGNLTSDVRALNNNLSSENNLNGSMNNNLGMMNNGAINSATPNGTLPFSTGIIDNKVPSIGTVNIGTTGSLNTSGTVNTGGNISTSGTGNVNTSTPTTPIKKTK